MNAAGEAQARQLAERLAAEPVECIFTSPRARAARTAEILGHLAQVRVESVALLRETDFGAWEGLRADEIAAKFAAKWRAWQKRPDVVAPPGGESGLATWQRVRPAIRAICGQRSRGVVVVAHRTLNRVLLCRWMSCPLRDYRRLEQGEACLNILDLDTPQRAASLIVLNDTCHLGPGRSS